VKLVLSQTRLQQDSIATLEKLPKLKMLTLKQGSYVSSELLCSSQGFPQLEILQLRSLRPLKDWTVEQGAMINLKHLRIQYCDQLQQVPEGLMLLTTLEKLY
jgi:disease resistance protein RPM1